MSVSAPGAAPHGQPPTGNPVGIICGGGTLPFAVADAVVRKGRPVFLFALRGIADPGRVSQYPGEWISLGQFGRFKRLARAQGCRDIVWIGALARPSVWQIRFDLQTLRLLPAILASFKGGDDHLLSSIGRIFEAHGFRLLGAHDVAPDILAPSGAMTRRAPTQQDISDMALAAELLKATGKFDVGQGAVVAMNHVLAVEGVDGTDGMLAHLAELRLKGRIKAPAGTGVLMKAAKPGQDRRFDLPTIGPQTVKAAAAAGLGGIGVIAGEVVIAEIERMIAEADRAGLFVYGVGKPE